MRPIAICLALASVAISADAAAQTMRRATPAYDVGVAGEWLSAGRTRPEGGFGETGGFGVATWGRYNMTRGGFVVTGPELHARAIGLSDQRSHGRGAGIAPGWGAGLGFPKGAVRLEVGGSIAYGYTWLPLATALGSAVRFHTLGPVVGGSASALYHGAYARIGIGCIWTEAVVFRGCTSFASLTAGGRF